MRKLASIQEVKSIEPIDGADRIELAHVLGWQCVVNKNQFKAGDLAVYFEIDSFLPVRKEFEFMRKTCFTTSDLLGEGFKLKTQKFRGAISQGLLLPAVVFPEIHSPKIGDDVTEQLGVRKWAVKERSTESGTIIGTLPDSIPHTEEARIQAMPELLKEFAGIEYYISTKLDGSSHSVSIDEKGFHVAGHNYEYKDGAFFRLVEERGYKEKLESFAEREHLKSLTVQGELCGPGIQGNKLKINAPEWYVFTVIEDGKRAGLERMLEICGELGLPHVPIEETGTNLPAKYPTVESILARSEGDKEGIVIRPVKALYSELTRNYLSMKAVNNRYLLKNDN